MSKASRQDLELRAIRERAAEWVCELQEDTEHHSEFAVWVRQSPRHVEEFLFAATAWKALDDVGPRSDAEVEKAIAAALSAAAESDVNVVSWPIEADKRADPPLKSGAKRPRHPMQWAAAFIAAIAIAVLGWHALDTHSTYTTAIGEQRSIRLTDGSVLYLNTASRAKILFSDTARDIELTGEGLFVVVPDRMRPFRVIAGNTIIQAIGTQFNVNRRAGNTKVSVLEGKVRITDDETQASAVHPPSEFLEAGQEAAIAYGHIAKHVAPNIAEATAWRERRLVFRGETLEAIANEVNRYNPRRFRIEGDAARTKRLVGTFAADDPEALLRFLQRYEDLSVQVNEEEFIVRAR